MTQNFTLGSSMVCGWRDLVEQVLHRNQPGYRLLAKKIMAHLEPLLVE